MAAPIELIRDEQGCSRCWWCGVDPLYVDYHDREWARPVEDDVRLFEKICLEGFQAGLSWITILRKRESFRKAFAGFECEKLVRFDQRQITRLLKNEQIVRHRGKIESTINNARRAIELRSEFGSLTNYFRQFRPKTAIVVEARAELRSTSDESTAMSRDLKRRGWSFVGPTTCYAFMQAMGMVNDHLVDCHVWREIEELQRATPG